MAIASNIAYGKIHTARFGRVEQEIAPLEFVRPLSELCLRAAALHFRHRPTFAGVPEKYKVTSDAPASSTYESMRKIAWASWPPCIHTPLAAPVCKLNWWSQGSHA